MAKYTRGGGGGVPLAFGQVYEQGGGGGGGGGGGPPCVWPNIRAGGGGGGAPCCLISCS